MDELDLIRDFVATVPGPPAGSRSTARAALEAQIAGAPDRSRRGAWSPSWKRLVPAVALAAAFAGVAVLIGGPFLRGDQASTAAAAALGAASRAALLQPAHVLQPGEYAYTKSEGAYFDEQDRQGHTWGALVRTTREAWFAADGSGRIRQRSDTPVFLAAGDRAKWEAAGSPPLTEFSRGETYDRQFGRGQLAYPLDIDGFHQDQLLRLAGNPDALAAAIRAQAETNSKPLGWEMLTIVGDLLSESVSPPQLRASLYQVTATIPGIELVGTVRDRAGRQGTAIAASRADQRYELIFDPKTSTLLASEETLRRPIQDTHAPVGTALAYTLYLESKITKSSTAP